MTRARFFDLALFEDSAGVIHKGINPVITVYQQGTTTPLVDTLYAADTGGTTLSNPFTGGPNGEVEFFIDTEKRVSIKYDGTAQDIGHGETLGVVTRNMEGVWPDPGTLKTVLRSPDGSKLGGVSNDGVFTMPGLLRSLRRWNPEDYGCVPGSTGTNKAANKAAFEAMWAAIGAAGGGDVIIGNQIPTNPLTLNHGAGFSVPITVSCRNGAGGFLFFGAAGPFLDLSTTIGNRLDHCGLQDPLIEHAEEPTSGATVHLGYCFDFSIEGLRELVLDDHSLPADESPLGAFIGIEARNPFVMRHSIIQLKTNVSSMGSVTPIGVLLSNPTTDTIAGPELYDSEISGSGVGLKSYGLRFAGAGLVDTPRISRCLIKDNLIGIVCNSNTGGFANAMVNELFIDGSGRGIFLSPPGPISNGQFGLLWISATAAALDFDESNGGSIDDMAFRGGRFTNSLTTCVNIGAGVTGIQLLGLKLPTSINTAGNYGILMGGTSGAADKHMVQGCQVEVGASSGGAARFSTAATHTHVEGNEWIGKDAIQGFTAGSNGNVYSGNGF